MSDALPPDYVNVPARLVYDKTIPPVVRDTYCQIRGLAWKSGYKETPPYQFKDLAQVLGKTVSVIYEHVRILRERHWLLFRDAGSSTYIFSFTEPKNPSSFSENQENALLSTDVNSLPINSNNQLLKKAPSENPENYEGKRDPTLNYEAVILYRRLTHITANPVQRDNMVLYVNNFPLWEASIKHWLGHGWSKMNVSGMIDSYKKGGEAGCSLCLRAKQGSKSNPEYESTVDRVKKLMEKRKNGNG